MAAVELRYRNKDKKPLIIWADDFWCGPERMLAAILSRQRFWTDRSPISPSRQFGRLGLKEQAGKTDAILS
jgi:hypothetical protein